MKRRERKIVAIMCGLAVLVSALLTGLYWQNLAAWYRFIVLFERLGPNENGYMEYRHRETGIVMVRVPGGSSISTFKKKIIKNLYLPYFE